jgi:hypothetical protein
VLSTERDQRRAAHAASEARDRAQFVLGGISLVIWFVVAFTLSVQWFVDRYTGQPLLLAGGVAFLVAALPWLAYPALTRRFTRR